MIKRAVILHGTDGNPEANWFPWVKKRLEEQGYQVWVPELPNNHTPNRSTYNDFLLDSDWDFEDNVVVGHSSGAVEVLNLLMDERCPHIKLGVMVSAWPAGEPIGDWDEGQFDDLFPKDGLDFKKIKNKADKLLFVHGDNDPYCPLEDAQYLSGELQAELIAVPNGGHLGDGFTELPQMWDVIKDNI